MPPRLLQRCCCGWASPQPRSGQTGTSRTLDAMDLTRKGAGCYNAAAAAGLRHSRAPAKRVPAERDAMDLTRKGAGCYNAAAAAGLRHSRVPAKRVPAERWMLWI